MIAYGWDVLCGARLRHELRGEPLLWAELVPGDGEGGNGLRGAETVHGSTVCSAIGWLRCSACSKDLGVRCWCFACSTKAAGARLKNKQAGAQSSGVELGEIRVSKLRARFGFSRCRRRP
ncbi:hypothetical protein TorRG33x02_056220 [Trema orientale]|uniref:Uncharacterized protein n=1 Tax=Trema orientale TaxID=63057 RepID=A0A2P5FKR6_TREOI|nr:hypothetical protein TorRG33x02_056220 [Trema orientale]